MKLTLFAILLTFVACGNKQSETNENTNITTADPWQRCEEIIENLKDPVFPDKIFSILDYGAVADGETNCREAINKAIVACSEAGGGKVVVPKGEYLSGAIYLESNVNLHMEDGAVLMFSTNPEGYLPLVYTRWEGVELMNYSPLIYSYKEKNIAVTGNGVLDGQAKKENWWKWNGGKRYILNEGDPSQKDKANRLALFEMGEKGVPVKDRKFGDGHYLRPQFFQPYQCENVLMQDFTIKSSPMWILHPVLCDNVIIRGVNVDSKGPNTDGCDPESCKNVLIENCTFNTGDDCIALKSGRNNDGRRINRPIENVVVRNCNFKNGHGGFVVGSEITGGAKNIFVENCYMNSPHLTRAVRIKTNSARGGTIEDVYIRNIEVGKVSESLLKVNLHYEDGEGHGHNPTVRNIVLENITCKETRFPLFMLGYEDSKISGVTLKNVTVEDAKEASIIRHVGDIVMDDVKFQTSRKVNLWGTVVKEK
ncbi:MAG: glycoside hydrolase family 28 protein [Mangrovibacterium sp.]